jgi:hypothetical protein
MDVKNMTLAEFLLARIAEDEWVANGLNGATRIIGNTPDFYGVGGPAAADFWQRFDPARVLAECEAKRRIVELHVATERAVATIAPLDDVIGDAFSQSALAVTTGVLQLLALPYADHPEFREEWRP